jgi:DNA-binding NtrC family response regulator
VTRILVLDDGCEMPDALGDALQDAGHAVLLSSTRHDTDALRRQRFDVVIARGPAAGRDGMELLRALKAADPGTVIIVLTGGGAIGDATAELGADRVLATPPDFARLLDLVEARAGRPLDR